MEIKERIKCISEYFKEMQIVTVDNTQMIYVVVKFPRGWEIEHNLNEKFSTIVEMGNEPDEYYFFTELDNEYKVFDAIEYTIEKMKNAIERANLLKEKILELKSIFQNENITLSELHTLNFTWDKTEHISTQDIMCDNENMIIANNSVSVSTTSNNQDTTTSAKVETQYTSEDNKNNKKNKK